MMSEIFGGRGAWDAARIITVLLAAFSLASWGLELSMDLSELEGEADLLNRPPPVFLRNDTNDTTWQVKLQPCRPGFWPSPLGMMHILQCLTSRTVSMDRVP